MFIVTEHNELFLRSVRSETHRAPKGAQIFVGHLVSINISLLRREDRFN